MEAVQVTKEERQVLDAMRAHPALIGAFAAMIAVVQSGALDDKNAAALANASEALTEPKITATPTGARADLSDSREDFAPHRAYLFSVASSKGTVLDELKTLLGEHAANRLAKDWGGRCDLNQKLPETQVALFLDSNNKARNRSYADSGDKTTQEEDFQATEHQFADGLAATLLCARIFKKAQGREPLSEGEEDLYQKLKCGSLNSLLGALSIDADGCLRADRYYAFGRQSCWALGSPLSPELK